MCSSDSFIQTCDCSAGAAASAHDALLSAGQGRTSVTPAHQEKGLHCIHCTGLRMHTADMQAASHMRRAHGATSSQGMRAHIVVEVAVEAQDVGVAQVRLDLNLAPQLVLHLVLLQLRLVQRLRMGHLAHPHVPGGLPSMSLLALC